MKKKTFAQKTFAQKTFAQKTFAQKTFAQSFYIKTDICAVRFALTALFSFKK
jgi:hypothetical protein